MKQLKPLIDTCQYCLTSRANQALRSLANAGFQNRGVCLQAFPSFPSPLPPPPSFIFWFSFHFSRDRNRKSPSTVFFCSETKRKRLLRRLMVLSFKFRIIDVYTEMSPGNCDILFDDATMTYHNLTSLLTFLI